MKRLKSLIGTKCSGLCFAIVLAVVVPLPQVSCLSDASNKNISDGEPRQLSSKYDVAIFMFADYLARKYKNKLTIWISNYSKNPELKSKLKHNELLKQIKDNYLDYDYVQDLTWGYTSPLNPKKLRENSKHYFEECGNNCVAVFKGKIYICPRAGVFALKGIYSPELNEVIDLNIENNPKILKKKLINFYSRESFSACNYCTILDDRAQDRILPAQQIID